RDIMAPTSQLFQTGAAKAPGAQPAGALRARDFVKDRSGRQRASIPVARVQVQSMAIGGEAAHEVGDIGLGAPSLRADRFIAQSNVHGSIPRAAALGESRETPRSARD